MKVSNLIFTFAQQLQAATGCQHLKNSTVMKKSITKKYLGFALAAVALLTSCSDSNSDGTPAAPSKLIIYPASLIERSTGIDGTTTSSSWTFAYNDNNKIKSYTLNETVAGDKVTIVETTTAHLDYYTNVSGAACIDNTKTHTYKYFDAADPTATNSYSEEVTENVTLNASGYVSSIEIKSKRTSLPDSTMSILSSKYVYTYSGEYCTACTYSAVVNGEKSTTNYKFSWSGENLAKTQIDYQDYNNNVNSDTYTYSWNANSYATLYTFNISAFIVGPEPQIYGAMRLFGKVSANLLQKEVRTGYRIVADETRQKSSVTKNYSFFDNSAPSTVMVTVSSPSFSEFSYTFK